jgi:hypothetical protein
MRLTVLGGWRQARQAGAKRLLLTDLWPGTDHAAAVAEAVTEYGAEIGVAVSGAVVAPG